MIEASCLKLKGDKTLKYEQVAWLAVKGEKGREDFTRRLKPVTLVKEVAIETPESES